MKTTCIYVINVTASNSKYKTEDTSTHYINAKSEREAMDYVRKSLGDAGWEIKGSSIRTGIVIDITEEAR